MPHSLRTSRGLDLRFDENSVSLSASEKDGLVRFVQRLRAENWCPLEGVFLAGYASDSEGTPGQTQQRSLDRANGVAQVLHLLGIPARIVLAEGKGATSPAGFEHVLPSPRVEVEFFGMAAQEGCPVMRTNSGFRIR